MRVFIGLTEIAGYYGNLAAGFRELGVDATFVNLGRNPFAYGTRQRKGIAVRVLHYLAEKRATSSRSRPIQWACWKALDLLARALYFGYVCTRYDAFIFGFNSTFFGYLELPILKLLNKRIVYVFNGSDSRPTYLDGSEMASDRGLTIDQCIARTRAKKAMLRKIERYADAVVANPLSAQLHEKPFVSFLLTGIPYPLPEIANISNEKDSERALRILHSPSHPEAKGTTRIREAIAILQKKGHRIDLFETSGRPNREVLEELARCDFVIDQLYSDQPMAGFGAEAAGFGKPAVTGGYGGTTFPEIMPSHRIVPTLYCHPDEIESAIEKLIVDAGFRQELGTQARQFVGSMWSQKQVASNYLQVIQGTIPSSWIFKPRDIRYVHGACLPEDRARTLVAATLERGGLQALQLDDKPELVHLLRDFSNAAAH